MAICVQKIIRPSKAKRSNIVHIQLSLESTKELTDEEKRVLRPNEKELDDFYCRWNHFLSEITKDSRTTLHQVEHADTKLQNLKDELDAMTLLEGFPPSKQLPQADGPIMPGYYGDSSPQKPHKKDSGGI